MDAKEINPKKVKRAIMLAAEASGTSHTHPNKTLLDNISQADFDQITYNTNAITGIANILGITLNVNGTVSTEAYTTHSHSYIDGTINDTADGTGIQTDTTKVTGGVS